MNDSAFLRESVDFSDLLEDSAEREEDRKKKYVCLCEDEKVSLLTALTYTFSTRLTSLSSQEQATQRSTATRHSIHSLGRAHNHCLAGGVGRHALLVHCSHTYMPAERSHA